MYRVELINGRYLLCGGIIHNSCILVGQLWASAAGANRVVTIEDVYLSSGSTVVKYSWFEGNEKKTHEKLDFSFQCRYCLVLEDNKIPEWII